VASSDALTWVRRLARLGLVARGLTYLILAWFALAIAIGQPHRQASDSGAFELLAGHAWGVVLLVVMAAGFAGYAAWSLSRAASDETGTAARVAALGQAVVYGFLCYLAAALAVGSGGGSGGDPAPLAARAMHDTGGQVLVGAAGIGIIIGGGVLAWRAAQRRFLDDLRTRGMSTETERLVTVTGVVGSMARGLVVVLVGVFLTVAGVTHKAGEAKGLDAALVDLARHPLGAIALGFTAFGFALFGVFSAIEARYIET
jgi:Domain of Unknown Function (DUF1206)